MATLLLVLFSVIAAFAATFIIDKNFVYHAKTQSESEAAALLEQMLINERLLENTGIGRPST